MSQETQDRDTQVSLPANCECIDESYILRRLCEFLDPYKKTQAAIQKLNHINRLAGEWAEQCNNLTTLQHSKESLRTQYYELIDKRRKIDSDLNGLEQANECSFTSEKMPILFEALLSDIRKQFPGEPDQVIHCELAKNLDRARNNTDSQLIEALSRIDDCEREINTYKQRHLIEQVKVEEANELAEMTLFLRDADSIIARRKPLTDELKHILTTLPTEDSIPWNRESIINAAEKGSSIRASLDKYVEFCSGVDIHRQTLIRIGARWNELLNEFKHVEGSQTLSETINESFKLILADLINNEPIRQKAMYLNKLQDEAFRDFKNLLTNLSTITTDGISPIKEAIDAFKKSEALLLTGDRITGLYTGFLEELPNEGMLKQIFETPDFESILSNVKNIQIEERTANDLALSKAASIRKNYEDYFGAIEKLGVIQIKAETGPKQYEASKKKLISSDDHNKHREDFFQAIELHGQQVLISLRDRLLPVYKQSINRIANTKLPTFTDYDTIDVFRPPLCDLRNCTCRVHIPAGLEPTFFKELEIWARQHRLMCPPPKKGDNELLREEELSVPLRKMLCWYEGNANWLASMCPSERLVNPDPFDVDRVFGAKWVCRVAMRTVIAWHENPELLLAERLCWVYPLKPPTDIPRISARADWNINLKGWDPNEQDYAEGRRSLLRDARKEIDRRMKDLKAQSEHQGMFKNTAKKKVAQHYEWLVRYQVLGESYNKIAKHEISKKKRDKQLGEKAMRRHLSVQQENMKSKISHAVDRTAELVVGPGFKKWLERIKGGPAAE